MKEIQVKDRMIEYAKRIRSKRDEKYANLYTEKETDMRWVGDLGELCLALFLKHKKVNYDWELESVTDNFDFLIEEKTYGVKTVKRKNKPKEEYTAQITAKHIEEPVDRFLFLSYEYPKKIMWLLGWIDRLSFREEARYYKAGDQVHQHYTIRPGHEIYNIEIFKLHNIETMLCEAGKE